MPAHPHIRLFGSVCHELVRASFDTCIAHSIQEGSSYKGSLGVVVRGWHARRSAAVFIHRRQENGAQPRKCMHFACKQTAVLLSRKASHDGNTRANQISSVASGANLDWPVRRGGVRGRCSCAAVLMSNAAWSLTGLIKGSSSSRPEPCVWRRRMHLLAMCEKKMDRLGT